MKFLEDTTFASKKRDVFIEQLIEEDSKKKKISTNIGNILFTDDGTIAIKKKKKTREYPLRQNGIEMLLSFLKMPVKFYLNVAPDDMLVRDINRMIGEIKDKKEIFVHLINKEIRGIGRPTCVVRPSEIFKESMFGKKFVEGMYDEKGVRITSASKRNVLEPQPGDITRIGTRARHSDISYFGTNIVPFMFRLICKNGVVVSVENPFVNSLKMRLASSMAKKDVIATFNGGLKGIEMKSSVISDGLDFMNSSPLSEIPNSLTIMNRVRSTVGSSVFDQGLGSDIITEVDNPRGKKTILINSKYNAYDALNKTTRMAKKLPLLEKDRVESLAGELVISAARRISRN